ncbi:MAG: ATP-binding protein [Leptospiraceae bacterium]|nr:MAG: ATP-binding protein [Leptospiraceae bacterium]
MVENNQNYSDKYKERSNLTQDDVKIQNIVNLLLEKKKVRYTFKTNHDPIINYLHAILHRILSELDLTFLTETLHVIILEMISNFLKAIAKRIYFKEKKLDITNYKDYVENIPRFKSEVLEYWDTYKFNLEEHGYFLFFDFIILEDKFVFYIKNNVKVNIFEKERIEKRLTMHLNDESYYNEIDSTEGGGLGLLITLSLLENSGISKNNFKMDFKADSTTAILIIPLKLNKPQIETYLREIVLNKIETLPSFPEYIQELIDKCDSGEVTTDYIINKIIKDPGLTSQILKLASSAGYITRKKNPDLKLAINLLGLKQLKHLLMIYAAKNVFNKVVERKYLEDIWYESNRIAFFARKLQKKEELKETSFIIGILNLIGKLVIYSLNAKEIQKIKEISKNKINFNDHILEELEIGISYPEIGAILAETWKFPENVVYGIRYQYKPLQISDDKIDLIYPVYFAKCINEVINNRFSYDFIEYKVLRYYSLLDKREQFEKLFKSLKEEFESIYTL